MSRKALPKPLIILNNLIHVCKFGQVRAECISFLQHAWPPKDAERLSKDYLQETADLALEAHSSNGWAKAVPWPLFLNYVLPYARCTMSGVYGRSPELCWHSCLPHFWIGQYI